MLPKKKKKGKYSSKNLEPESTPPQPTPPQPTPPPHQPLPPPIEIQGLKGCAIVSGAQIVTAAMKISTDTAEEVRKVESAEGTKDEKCYGENPDAVSLETRPVENNGWTAESSQSKRERHQLEYENDEDNNEHISLLPRDPTTTHGPLGTPPTSPVEQLPQGSLETTSTICPGWDQNTSIPKEKEKGKSMPIPEIADDSFLETWDMIIHRCQHCNRPFGTRTRLLDHLSVWHVPGSPNIETHQTSEILSELNGFEDIHVIAEGGDIVIQVKSPSGVDYWWVASQVLWTTSRVFRAMFGPDSSYQEAVKVRRSKVLGFPPALVLLEDDDPKALGLVLAALHHRNDLLPDKISFEQLVNIAAIIDKYELQCVLANKLSKLSEPPRALKSIQDEDWLFVSYVFGHAVTFTEVSTDLILCGALGTDGALVFSKGESTHCLSEFTPESIISKFTRQR